jgi:hypothetical protein
MVSKGVEGVLSVVFLAPTATVTTNIPTRRSLGSNLGEHGTTSLILVIVIFVVFHLSSIVVLTAGGCHPIVVVVHFDFCLFRIRLGGTVQCCSHLF